MIIKLDYTSTTIKVDQFTGECPECHGEGETFEYYNGRGNFYGSPDERVTCCQRCDGTGMIEETDVWVKQDTNGNVHPLSHFEFYQHQSYLQLLNYIERIS